MPWTDEMVESLKKMWDEGLSTGEIGRRLGVSKNSIVGKVHRLQLVARPSPIKRKDGTPVTRSKSPDKDKDKSKPKTPKKETPKTQEKVIEVEKTAPKNPTEVKTSKPQSTVKPTPAKADIKEKEYDNAYVNVSIPVAHTPKKPGDKITVTDLDNHTCRWPIGDPKDENFHFCGANVRIGQTYCEEHAAIAYVKNIKK